MKSAGSLTVEEARRIVAPLYDALNEPGKKDVAALLAKATNPDYRSYSTNEDWLARDQLAEVFKTMAIDVFTVKNGKFASAYHVENWMTALQQING